jgi:hypothetical protein
MARNADVTASMPDLIPWGSCGGGSSATAERREGHDVVVESLQV